MTPSPRRYRLAAAVSLALLSFGAASQSDPAAPGSPAPIIEQAPRPGTAPTAAPTPDGDAPKPSALTAELFYELLLGELSARSGEPGDAFTLVLDAARKTDDPKLYQRAVEVALQARAGESALRAARAWKEALPQSREASRFELQILIALNRIAETAVPLRAEVAATPLAERPLLMAVIARNYARAPDKPLAASVVEQALVDALADPKTAGLAWTTVGRLRLVAGDAAGALEAAEKGHAADADSEGPAVLALDLIDPQRPQAEAILKRYLQTPKAVPELRMAYARLLLEMRRYPEAGAELATLTSARPEMAEAWLLLGTLQALARKDAAAEVSLKRYLELSGAQRETDERKRGDQQAYLQLAQLAERRKDFPAAESWLRKADDSGDLVVTQTRRAGLLARRGKVDQALQLVRDLPERKPEDAKLKFSAQVQLLREARQFQAAYDMLAKALATTPDDTDLLYDQAMVAEKLLRFEEMESMLRRVMVLKPENQHAYNALGYSLAERRVRLEEARTLVQKALSLAPGDPFITDSLGWVEFRMGNAAEAARILQGAYEQRPDPEIGAHLGEVLWSSGQRERALAIWKEASIADADNETLQETLRRLRVKL